MLNKALLVLVAVLAVVVIVLLVRGDDEDGGARHTATSVAACLRNASTTAEVSTRKDDLDAIAANAGSGGIYLKFGNNAANIAVERNGTDGRNTEAQYRLFAKGFGTDPSKILKRYGDSVVMWDKTPSGGERRPVERCL